MESKKQIERVVISGGGTGGHIFPAIAIADEIKRRNPDVKILFVGAQGKMEMEKVPEAGYDIIGLQIAGFQRKLSWSNVMLPFKLLKSLMKARSILKDFKPQVVIGVGGYASGPTLRAAQNLGIPTLIQEQNSFPGKTNKLLAKRVRTICTAYSGLETYFPSEKIVCTGNPTRKEMISIDGKKEEAQRYYALNPAKKTILIIGGSLGARTLNNSVEAFAGDLPDDVQIIWQCGKLYHKELHEKYKEKLNPDIKLHQFIARMDLAYAAADIIISRAGAISVSELCLIGKAVILVPSPNVAEDHQTKNAMALVQVGAAILVKDKDAVNELFPVSIKLLNDNGHMQSLSESIRTLGRPKATEHIVDELQKLI